MKIAIDSNDLPAETRLERWRGMLCDTYMGIDCHFPGAFRSAIEGHAVDEHTLTRIRSTPHKVERSRTLIKRDEREMVFFGVLLAGRATTTQSGREAVMERGTIVISDSSRPLCTHVVESADIIWLTTPKKPMGERLRNLEDLIAIPLRPTRPVDEIAIGLMAGFDEALANGLPAHDAERLTTQLLDVLALTILSGDLPPQRARLGPDR